MKIWQLCVWVALIAFNSLSINAYSQGAFQQGFQIGADVYNGASRNRSSQAQDERDQIEFERRQEQRKLEIKKNDEIEAAFKILYPLTPPAQPLTPRERNQTQRRIALATNNYIELGRLNTEAQILDLNETYTKSLKEWDTLTLEQSQTLIDELSNTVGILSWGEWEKGPGKLECFARYVPANNKILKLRTADARELFAINKVKEFNSSVFFARQAAAIDRARDHARKEFELKSTIASMCIEANARIIRR